MSITIHNFGTILFIFLCFVLIEFLLGVREDNQILTLPFVTDNKDLLHNIHKKSLKSKSEALICLYQIMFRIFLQYLNPKEALPLNI